MDTSQTNDQLDLSRQEDVQFCQAMLRQARKDFEPGTPIFMTWGLISFLGYSGTYFLVNMKMYHYIFWLWIGLDIVGLLLSGYFGYILACRERKSGLVSRIGTQISWVWFIMISNGLLWSMLGYFKDWYGGPGFFWALIYSIALSMTGVVYAREWLWGGLIILVGMLTAHFIKDYSYLILGISMAIGCIVPSLISRKRLKEMENNIGQSSSQSV